MFSQHTVVLRPNRNETRILSSRFSDEVMFFVKRFIQNTDWVMDLLSITDKLLRQSAEPISRFERLVVEDYLQFRLFQSPDGIVLVDRGGRRVEAGELLNVREQILDEVEKRALFIYYNPARHSLPKAFKQVLAKSPDKYNQEEKAVLREAYLSVQNGRIYTLRGKELTPYSLSQRWIWKWIA